MSITLYVDHFIIPYRYPVYTYSGKIYRTFEIICLIFNIIWLDSNLYPYLPMGIFSQAYFVKIDNFVTLAECFGFGSTVQSDLMHYRVTDNMFLQYL